ncbi:hypothetical protein EYC98_05100 [Halieaceae bacterium IMCC14734]|uniref:Uncharacterized protein n=1 Tax=Candidatus Litorirhabdus singularis TaxID=2518993 RepID=A0ABT3TD98_9GAMM|nr:hypothetical protein [Candidatus Litorirhabdus singularis]MCX2980244.1 hypothetical protein [Candidatus Litorirhabdus singularis]
MLRAPLDFNLSEAEPEAGRRFGMRLLMPVAVGLTQYEDFVDIPELDIEDIQSISVVPGVEFPIWLTDEWTLSPFAQLGFGMDTKSDSRSIIWGSGARVRWEPRDAPQWLVGGEFLWAGNNPNNNQPTTDFTRWGVGAEYRIDTQQQLFDREISWHLRALLWQYSDALRFEPPLQLFKLNSATEVGVSVGFSRPFNIFGYKFHQGGIGYEWADDFKAVKFYTTFPF